MIDDNMQINIAVWRLILAPIIDNYTIKSWMMFIVGGSALVGMVGLIYLAPAIEENSVMYSFTAIIAILHIVASMPLINHEYYEWRQAKYGKQEWNK